MDNERSLTAETSREGSAVTRRTFVRGAGWLTLTSAIGFGVTGCAPKTAAPLSETGETDEAPADPNEGVTFGHACCNLNCTSHCHLKSHVKDGKILTVSPGNLPGREDYANVCLRGIALSQRTQDENARVMFPMKRTGERGSGEFERISWDQAIAEIAEKLKEAQAAHGEPSAAFYSFTGNSGQLTNSACTRFATQIGATTFDIEGIMGDHGASMGMILAYGTKRGSHDTRDYRNSNMVVLWGRNVADTHTCDFRYLVEAREAGAKIVVVDPRLSSSCAIADQWLPIKPQTDAALALCMINLIIENNLHASDWLCAHSNAPFLVKESDGTFLMKDDAWLVWDEQAGAAVPYDATSNAALSGTFEVDGETVRTAFDHLRDEAATYTLERTAEITGLAEEMIEQFALDYAKAQPAGIRMGQGMQRVWNSHTPFRAVAVLAAVAGYVGVSGGGASHMGGKQAVVAHPEVEIKALGSEAWSNTNGREPVMVKSSTLYDQIISGDPYPIDFMWFANSNFVNMSPDMNKIVDEVLPHISTIVTVDPYWTWTARYSDYVLPACNYWEKWDMEDRTPWIVVSKPVVEPMGESKSDVEIFSLLANAMGLGALWDKTDEEWVRDLPNTDHPAWEGFDFDTVAEDGIFPRADAIFEPQILYPDSTFDTPSGRFQLYNDELVPYEEEVPTYKPRVEDPASELGQRYPLTYIQFHDRLNVHSQHILIDELSVVQSEPQIEMNPLDAQARGIAHGDEVVIRNDRGQCTMKAFLTEGIVPGVVATASGWTPDYFIDGCYQELTHLTLNPTEEFISQTSTAFYDVLVEIEKA